MQCEPQSACAACSALVFSSGLVGEIFWKSWEQPEPYANSDGPNSDELWLRLSLVLLCSSHGNAYCALQVPQGKRNYFWGTLSRK